MAEEIHIRKPLAVGNDSIAKGFFVVLIALCGGHFDDNRSRNLLYAP